MKLLNGHLEGTSPYQFRTAVLGARPDWFDNGHLVSADPPNIGDAIAARLLQKGHRVGVDDCYRSSAQLARELAAGGWFPTGPGHEPEGGYFAPTMADLLNWDHLVITLGHGVPSNFRSVEAGEVEDTIRATLILPLECARRYIQVRRGHEKRGRILFIGSYGHDHVLSNSAPYCAAKAGLAHATRCLAWDFRGEFEIMIVNPYHVPSTPLGAEVVERLMAGGMTREEAEAYQRKDMVEGQEHLTPVVIAEYVAWMLRAPEAVWSSGQQMNLYGGVR